MSVPISFSIVTKTKGILTKRFSLNDDGELEKDGKQCFIANGTVETITCDFSEVGGILDKLENNQALVHGVAEEAPCEIVSQRLQSKYPNAITRTKDKFKYPDFGLMMFDYDMSDNGPKCTKQELIGHIRSLSPQLQKAAMIWRPSASSCITDGEKEYLGIKNQRIYVPYMNADFMADFVTALEKIAWDKGLGYIEVSAAGTPLMRCIFDTAVFSPERLDFASGAKCDPPLMQTMPESQYMEGEIVDLSVIPEVNETRVKALILQAKTDKAEDLNTTRKEYRKRSVERLTSEHKLTNKEAKQVVNARLKNRLMPKDVIYTNDMEPITIQSIIRNPDEYHGMEVRDPLEPDYGSAKAKIFVNDDGITINSFAHGGRVFMVTLDKETYMAWLADIPKDDLADCWLDNMDKFEGSSVDKDQIMETVKERTGISKGILNQDLRAKEKQVYEEITDGYGDLTHHEIANLMIASLPKHTVITEGMMYNYNGANCWQPKKLDEIGIMVAEKFDGLPKCSRGNDYSAVAKHMCNMMTDSKFFSGIPIGLATKDYYWYIHKGQLKRTKHKPEHRIRFILPYNMADENYEIPILMEFLEFAFSGDKSQIELLQRVFGAIIFCTLNPHHHKAVLLKGRGMNGKSVILDILKSLIPSQYISNVPPFKFADPMFAAQLAGKVLNVVSELERNQILPSAAFKTVVDDGELMGRHLYQQPFVFPSTAAHIFSSNWDVKTNDDSFGMQRRWIIFDFKNTVQQKDRIYGLGDLIVSKEAEGILRWAAEGALMLHKEGGFVETQASINQKKLMFDNVSSIKSFMMDEDIVIPCETGTKSEKNRVMRSGLYEAYRNWAPKSGYDSKEIVKKAYFNQYVEDQMGIQLLKGVKGLYWDGLRLKIK